MLLLKMFLVSVDIFFFRGDTFFCLLAKRVQIFVANSEPEIRGPGPKRFLF